MYSRSITELMDQISTSAAKSLSKMQEKLYKGELFIIIRDVKSSQAKEITEEFRRSFSINEKKKGGNDFIKRLFGGNVNLFTLNHFGDQSFFREILKLRDHFSKVGMQRTPRIAKDILEYLKIVMTQLVCDDSK